VRDTLGSPGLESGELLKRAEAAKFDVLLTVDRGLEYQQNLAERQTHCFLRKISFEDLLPRITTCLGHLRTIRPGEVVPLG
jgi:hypothetical protein